jgi:uncharacterized membrane protein
MNSRKMILLAMIAALYVALSLAVPILTYGGIQVRFAEALTLLPVIMPLSIWAVTLGCFVTNLVGVFTGANILGFVDVVVGTLTTLAAAYATMKLGKYLFKGYPILAALPPIIFNGLVIGLELTLVLNNGFSWSFFGLMVAQVSIGQTIAVALIGLPIIKKLSTLELFRQ